MKKVVARILGNFGVSFFSPLVSGNIAETVFNMGLTFEQTLIIALISSVFVTGLTVSRELEKFGKSR
jgi:hypothetical protein|tara:strand:- start:548 stop:748 length:201 start_codon:yes stop_codon:yes gene_type:complete